MVVAQVALSVVLLLGAGVLLRSLLHLATVSPGFETAHALRFGIGLPEKRYDTERKLIDFHRHLMDSLAALPGCRSVGAAARLPLRGGTAECRQFLSNCRSQHSDSAAPARVGELGVARLFRSHGHSR